MNQKELKELIEFLIEKDIAEFELERGDVKVKIKRAGEHTVVYAPGGDAAARRRGRPGAQADSGRSCCCPAPQRRVRRRPKKTCTW